MSVSTCTARRGSWRPAHGGEIVASAATCADTGNDVNDEIQLRDLGEHRLRDLSAPERLYQVIATGLEVDFPPLRTLDRTPNNLPTQPTVLIGRDVELERIGRHLDSSRVRILTLTGPGGIGKTRLALQAAANQADRVRDGVYFVDLAEVGDAAGALREIARALGFGVRAGADLRAGLAEQIGDRDLLLVLDNFEQVMSAADDVADLLRLCPRLRVIVTSRESLRVRGEQLIEVAPLSFPDGRHDRPSAADLANFEAVRLFVERASEARSDFSLTDENAPGRCRDLRAARRPAARDRACCGAAATVFGRGPSRPAANWARRPARRRARPAAAPAHAAKHDRVELRPAR